MVERNLEGPNGDTGYKLPYEDLIKHREFLVQLRQEQARSLDKHLIALNSGAIAISLFLVRESQAILSKSSVCPLVTSWALMVSSILATLLSFWFAGKACDMDIQEVDASITDEREFDPSRSKVWYKLTSISHGASILVFILGVISLLWFVVLLIFAATASNAQTG